MKTLGIWDEIKTLDTETSIPPTSMKIVYRFWYLYVAAVLPNKGAEIKLKDMFWVKISYRIMVLINFDVNIIFQVKKHSKL